ncbi:Protein kinase C-like 1 [Spathaspora sp. JA1]|nr:Protein kinase C-like 1 [Spathaspora sp. JA1]
MSQQQQKSEDVIKDIMSKIEVEKNMLEGYQNVKRFSQNPEVLQKCNSKILESQSIIDYYQDSLNKLTRQLSDLSTSSSQVPTNGAGHTSDRPSFSRLDLAKYECPSVGHKIHNMLQQLQFKLQVENQYREANQKMSHLYLMDGDRSSSNVAEGSKADSDQRIQLLEKALKKYQNIHIDSEDFTRDFALINTPKHARKPLSGRLYISIPCIRDIDHISTPVFAKKRETVIVVKIDDMERARTKPSKTDKWSEDFVIDVEKGHEIELSVLDKSGNNMVPVAINWLLLSDVAEEIRKKKVAKELGSNGWITASNLEGENAPTRGASFGATLPLPPTGAVSTSPTAGTFNSTPTPPPGNSSNDKIQLHTWLSVEPCGQILVNLNFEKSIVSGQKFMGPLERHGAIRQKKEEVFEQQGHHFVQKQFYNIMCCALCGEFLRYTGFQCQDCKFLCHKKCYSKVVTKCISKSGIDYDETKLKHQIPHRFEPITNHGTKWCCHCGYILPWGKKNVRKCTECGVMSHAQCTHLVPDFCGMSMEMANEILATIKSTKLSPKKPQRITLPQANEKIAKPQVSPLAVKEAPQEQYRISEDAEEKTRLITSTTNLVQEPVRLPHHIGKPTQQYPDQSYRPPLESDVSFEQNRDHEIQFRRHERGPSQHQQQQQLLEPVNEKQHINQFDQFDYQNIQTQDQIMPDVDQMKNPFQDPYRTLAPGGGDVDVRTGHITKPHHKPPKQKRKRRKVGLDDFQFLAVLGKGNFGKVMLAESRHTSTLCAIKVLKKDFIVENDEAESVKSEKRVFLTANKEKHPFLLNLHCCFQTENRIYFVMEYISGGDLMWHIQKSRFPAKRAKYYACEVLLGLKYFHDNGIVYRDLKLDNILLTTKGHIKIGDYGLCKENMWHQSTTSTFCGTPEFMAPEIVAGKQYDRSVDWWAFGVLLFQMLLCQSPFKGDDEDDIFNAIEHDEVKYPISLSRQTVLVLQALLTKDPSQRLGSGTRDAEEIMEHPYFHDVNFDDVLNLRIPAPYIPEIKSEHDYSNFDQEFTSETPRLTPVETVLSAEMQEQFRGFSHIAENATI